MLALLMVMLIVLMTVFGGATGEPAAIGDEVFEPIAEADADAVVEQMSRIDLVDGPLLDEGHSWADEFLRVLEGGPLPKDKDIDNDFMPIEPVLDQTRETPQVPDERSPRRRQQGPAYSHWLQLLGLSFRKIFEDSFEEQAYSGGHRKVARRVVRAPRCHVSHRPCIYADGFFCV